MRWRLILVPSVLLSVFWFESNASVIQVKDSLQQAIDSAHPGDTLVVPGGRIFQERIRLTKPLRLLGANSPTIQGNGRGSSLIVGADHCHLEGLTITGAGSDLNTLDSGVMIEANEVAVVNCRVESDAFGIYLRAANRCRIERNEVFGSPSVPFSQRGNGIHLWKTRTNTIALNRIRDKRDGLYLSFADHTTIQSNDVRNTRFGIHYMYSHYNRLLSNALTANAVGAILMFSQHSLAEGNTIFANRRHGLVLKQVENSRLLNNLVAGQNRGLFVQQGVQNHFQGNIVSSNDIGLYLSNGSEGNVFVGNAFIANVDQVWQPPYEAELGRRGPNHFWQEQSGNYWSDYAGADHNQDGRGDTPYYETDTYGYILDRYPETKVFALSPAIAAIRQAERMLPVLDARGVVDLFPLMRFATLPSP